MKQLWFLLLVSFLFFLLRLPSLIEPYWYGDEGIYEVIGMALNHGNMLYTHIWDNKPPLLYLLYGLAQGDQFAVRMYSIVAGLFSAVIFYFLSKNIFKSTRIAKITTIVYLLLFATPFIEGNIANAENFMLLPIVAAGFLIYKSLETKKKRHFHLIHFCAGILLGVAFLFKIIALFDFAALLLFILLISGKKPMMYVLGFFMPLFMAIMYFFVQGNLNDFIQATFFNNLAYVGNQNKFIIDQGLLVVKIIILLIAVGFVFWRKKDIPNHVAFIFLWFFFSIFSVLFSGKPWTHYLLVLIPTTTLLIGLLFDKTVMKTHTKPFVLGFLALVLCVSILFFKVNLGSVGKVFLYYQNFVLFVTNNKSTDSYQEYFDKKVTRDYEVASFIASKTKPGETIFVWGNNPQIYVLSKTLPPGKYTVEYHVMQSKDRIAETAKDISRTKPRFIVILSETNNFPFRIDAYTNKFSLKGADVYERNF